MHAVDDEAPLLTPTLRRRAFIVLALLLVLILLIVLPPYLNVNRYQRRVASAISASLGRSVHLDSIVVHILPLPGFTIQNFVVNDDPAFSAEPVMRANIVEARLRFASLWRRRIEISHITLDTPSINIVRRADGAWNLQSILMQASQLDSAPTAQQRAGTAPRFPYIEATDARINIKLGDDKLPFSVTQADVALWLPQPNQWRLRFLGHPVRTDTDVSDTGSLRVEATLGRAANLSSATVDLDATWKPTPLGEAAKLIVGRDLGWRGDVSAELHLTGTLAHAHATSDLILAGLRRADFVPATTLTANIHCDATALNQLHALQDIRCTMPTADAGSPTLILTGDMPTVTAPDTASLQLQLDDAPPAYALAWARLFTKRIPADVPLTGSLDLTLQHAASTAWHATANCICTLASSAQPTLWTIRLASDPALPDTLSLQAARDSTPSLTGRIDTSGYTLLYTSADVATAVATTLPPLGDAMPADATGPQQAQRTWNGPQTWAAATPAFHKPAARHRSRTSSR